MVTEGLMVHRLDNEIHFIYHNHINGQKHSNILISTEYKYSRTRLSSIVMAINRITIRQSNSTVNHTEY